MPSQFSIQAIKDRTCNCLLSCKGLKVYLWTAFKPGSSCNKYCMYANQVTAKKTNFVLHVQREGSLVNLYNSVSASRKLFFFVSSRIVFSHLVMETFPASLRGRNVKKGYYFLIRQILQNKIVSPQEVIKNISTLMVLPWSKDSST